jgi:prepilin-type N-terminal cleavage/methylation domain-containing protein
MKKTNNRGVSLIEIIVVVGIFAILAIISTRAVLLSLMGSKKSTTALMVRENVNYALGVIERQLRNAESVNPCPNSEPYDVLNYVDSLGQASSFSCLNIGGEGYVASGSARLTSDEVAITACSFVCSLSSSGLPPAVTIDFSAANSQGSSAKESSQITATTKIYLRTY